MLKLMKYEFRKTAFSKLILLHLRQYQKWHFCWEYSWKRIIFWQWERYFAFMCSDRYRLYWPGERDGTAERSEYEAELYVISHTPQQLRDSWGKSTENGISILVTGIFFVL